MKIVNAIELAKLPDGVIYSTYIPCVLGDLTIKGKTLSDTHWFDASLNSMEEMLDDLKEGDSSPLEIVYSRMVHDSEELFAVWELEDLKGLSTEINNAIRVTESIELLNNKA